MEWAMNPIKLNPMQRLNQVKLLVKQHLKLKSLWRKKLLKSRFLPRRHFGDAPENFISGDGTDEGNIDASDLLPSEILTNDPLLQEIVNAANQTAMARGGSPPTLPEEWTTALDRKIKQKE
jgi:hypothetical protein